MLAKTDTPGWIGAMLTANNFWAMTGHNRFMALNAFFEHLGLIAGFVLLSVMATQRPHLNGLTPFHRGFP